MAKKEHNCALCGAPLFNKSRQQKYCGSQRDHSSCSYKANKLLQRGGKLVRKVRTTKECEIERGARGSGYF